MAGQHTAAMTMPPHEAAPHREGPRLWFHASTGSEAQALVDLATRLRQVNPSVSVVLTARDRPRSGTGGEADFAAPPLDQRGATRRFLDTWRPLAVLWAGGPLRPQSLGEVAARKIPFVVTDMDRTTIEQRRRSWLKDPVRSCLAQADQVFADTPAARGLLLRLGLPSAKVRISRRLAPGYVPSPIPDETLVRIGVALSARPVWLALGTSAAEAQTVLDAHRKVLRLSHRMLLIWLPAADGMDAAEEQVNRTNMRAAFWDRGELPGDNAQVMILPSLAEADHWLRVAPLVMLGQTLAPGGSGQDPFPAAALGAAILHGRNTGIHAEAFEALSEAGAAQVVEDADGLGDALLHLSAADRAAEMALAGWQVATESAATTDALVDMFLDYIEGIDARA